MYARPQRQSKAYSEAMHKYALHISSMPSSGLPNSVLLSLLENVDAPINQPNKIGLPDALKARFERLSGLVLDDVRVHRNSETSPPNWARWLMHKGTRFTLGRGRKST